MAQYWRRKSDQFDQDIHTANPWAKALGHGDMEFPDPNKDSENK